MGFRLLLPLCAAVLFTTTGLAQDKAPQDASSTTAYGASHATTDGAVPSGEQAKPTDSPAAETAADGASPTTADGAAPAGAQAPPAEPATDETSPEADTDDPKDSAAPPTGATRAPASSAAAAPTNQEPPQTGPPAVALLDLETNNVDPSLAKVVNSLIAGAINEKPELRLVTMEEIRRVLDFEGDKSALGCASEATSCLAEIAGALGTDYVVFGDIGRIADRFVVNLSLYNTVNATSVGREQMTATNEADLAAQIAPMVDRLFAKVAAATAVVVPEPSGLRAPLLYAGGFTGLAGVVVAVVGLGVTALLMGSLLSADSPGDIRAVAFPGWIVSASIAVIGGIVAGAGAVTYGVGHVVE